MTQQEINQQLQREVNDLKQQLSHLSDLYFRQHFIDKDVFSNPVYFNSKVYFKDGTVFSLGTATGTKFGNATTEKIGFLGQTPIAQQSAITAPTTPGATYLQSEAQNAVDKINLIRAVLKNFGFIA